MADADGGDDRTHRRNCDQPARGGRVRAVTQGEEQREISEQPVVEEEADEARDERRAQARLPHREQGLAEILPQGVALRAARFRHPEQAGERQRYAKQKRREGIAPAEGGEEATQDRRADHGDAVYHDLPALAVDLTLFRQQFADQDDGQPGDCAEADALQHAQEQEPAERRRERAQATRNAIQQQPEHQHPFTAVAVADNAEDRGQHDRRRGEGDHHQADFGRIDPRSPRRRATPGRAATPPRLAATLVAKVMASGAR